MGEARENQFNPVLEKSTPKQESARVIPFIPPAESPQVRRQREMEMKRQEDLEIKKAMERIRTMGKETESMTREELAGKTDEELDILATEAIARTRLHEEEQRKANEEARTMEIRMNEASGRFIKEGKNVQLEPGEDVPAIHRIPTRKEMPAVTEPTPPPQPPKKGFWSTLFGKQ